MNVRFCWLTTTGESMCMSLLENVTNGSILASPAVPCSPFLNYLCTTDTIKTGIIRYYLIPNSTTVKLEFEKKKNQYSLFISGNSPMVKILYITAGTWKVRIKCLRTKAKYPDKRQTEVKSDDSCHSLFSVVLRYFLKILNQKKNVLFWWKLNAEYFMNNVLFIILKKKKTVFGTMV